MSSTKQAWNDHRVRLVDHEVQRDRGVLSFFAPSLTARLLPGQFVNLQLPHHVLRRPMAAAGGDAEYFRIVVHASGEGSRALLALAPGSELSALGPLGNTFPLTSGSAVLLSGGSGAGPLLFLAGVLAGRGQSVQVLHGAKDHSEAFLIPYFERSGAALRYFSEDGSLGEAGLPTQTLAGIGANTTVYAVGPRDMMKVAAGVCRSLSIRCYVSLEAHMACGVGACLSCIAETTLGQKHVCSDGPIFEATEVVW